MFMLAAQTLSISAAYLAVSFGLSMVVGMFIRFCNG